MTTNPIENAGLLPHLPGYIEQLGIPDTLEKAIAERNAWVESAAMFSLNEKYYRGLLDQIAAHLGPDAFTADDGSLSDSPLRAKLPELVKARTLDAHPPATPPADVRAPKPNDPVMLSLHEQFLRHQGLSQSFSNWLASGGETLAAPAGVDEVERAFPKTIGRRHLGEDRSDGERLCDDGHDVPAGHPLYWYAASSQYDDSDPCCLAHAIEQSESEQGWSADIAALPPTDAIAIREALKCAIGHIEHMAAWISSINGHRVFQYNFESLGEDMSGIKSALSEQVAEEVRK